MIMSIWCGTHQMHSTRNPMTCSRRVTTPQWHPIIVFSPSVDTDVNLAHQIVIVLLNASRKQAIRLKMFSAMCCSNIGITIKCRLDRTPSIHMWMLMLKNKLLWCVLPSPMTKNAQIDQCSNNPWSCSSWCWLERKRTSRCYDHWCHNC